MRTRRRLRQSRMCECPPNIKIGVVGCTARTASKTMGPKHTSMNCSSSESRVPQLSRATGIWLRMKQALVRLHTFWGEDIPKKEEQVGFLFDGIRKLTAWA